MTNLKAITKKNQSAVNKALQWNSKYDGYNDKRDEIECNIECYNDESKEWRQMDRKCESAWDRFLDYMSELPSNQQKAIYKHIN
jgi:hypothetical protein